MGNAFAAFRYVGFFARLLNAPTMQKAAGGTAPTMHELKPEFRDLPDQRDLLPADMLVLLRKVAAYDPRLLANLDQRYVLAWRGGKELPEGRAVLQALAAYVGAQQQKERNATATAHV